MQLEFDARVATPEFAEQFVEEAVAGGHRAVDADLAGQCLRLAHHRLSQLFPLFQCLAGELLEAPSLMGECHMSVVTIEECHAQALFKLAYGPTEGRRADMAAIARPAEVEGLGQCKEVFEGAYVHSLIIAHTGM